MGRYIFYLLSILDLPFRALPVDLRRSYASPAVQPKIPEAPPPLQLGISRFGRSCAQIAESDPHAKQPHPLPQAVLTRSPSRVHTQSKPSPGQKAAPTRRRGKSSSSRRYNLEHIQGIVSYFYSGRFIRFSIALYLGSSRSRSMNGSTFMRCSCQSRSSRARSSSANAASRSPIAAYTVANR